MNASFKNPAVFLAVCLSLLSSGCGSSLSAGSPAAKDAPEGARRDAAFPPLCGGRPPHIKQDSFQEGGVTFPLKCRGQMKLADLCVDVVEIFDLVIAVDGCDLTIERSTFHYRESAPRGHGNPHVISAAWSSKVTLRDVTIDGPQDGVIALGTASVNVEGGSFLGFNSFRAQEQAKIVVTGAKVGEVFARGNGAITLGAGTTLRRADASHGGSIRVEGAVLASEDRRFNELPPLSASEGSHLTIVGGEVGTPDHDFAILASKGSSVIIDGATISGKTGVSIRDSEFKASGMTVRAERGVMVNSSTSKVLVEKSRFLPNSRPSAPTWCGIVIGSSEAEIKDSTFELPQGTGICVGANDSPKQPARATIADSRVLAARLGLRVSNASVEAKNLTVEAGVNAGVSVEGQASRVLLVGSKISPSAKAISLENASIELKDTLVKNEKKTGVFSQSIP